MNQPCILLVDDDENDVFFMKHAFHLAKIQDLLQVVGDGQAAIDYLSGVGDFADRERFPLPSMILLDLKMPYKNGLEVLEWIRQQGQFHGMVIIVLTSSAHADDIDRAYQLGANSFVSKPASMEERTDLANAIKAFWLTHNLTPADCSK